MAEPTGLEPATSNVTGWRSNQLNYDSALVVISTLKSKIINPGGHEGTRTPNFLLVREAVYQLTYMPRNLHASLGTLYVQISFKKRALFDLTANCNATKNKPELSSEVKINFFNFLSLILAVVKRNSYSYCFHHTT